MALVALVTALIEKRAHGNIETEPGAWRGQAGAGSGAVPGRWSAPGLVLALLNIATLLLAGHPWSITYGFGLWGAKIAQAVGVDVASWEFWTWPAQAQALQSSVLADTVSVMDFGLVLGAALAAAIAGKFAPKAKIPLGSLLAAIVGGLLMGYGARLSFGCNIGALFSGIATGSLHGWLWFAAAFVGSFGGVCAAPGLWSRWVRQEMSTRNTLIFGAALAVSTAAIAYDHATKPVPPRPVLTAGTASTAGARPALLVRWPPVPPVRPRRSGLRWRHRPPPLKRPAEAPRSRPSAARCPRHCGRRGSARPRGRD